MTKPDQNRLELLAWLSRHPVPDKDAGLPPARPAPRRRPKQKASARPRPFGGPEADLELDLHGCALDEAMAKVEMAIEGLRRAGKHTLRVIHGHSGTGPGTIRGELGRRLRTRWNHQVEEAKRDPGNPGSTVLKLAPPAG